MRKTKMLRRKALSGLRRVGWLGVLLTGAALFGIYGASSPTIASGSTSGAGPSTKTTVVYAFNINPSADNLIPAPGTKRGVVSEGDESVINDQLTSTHEVKGGYPIIGFASGTCTFTRVSPDGQGKGSPYNSVLENCAVTGVLPHGSITAEGVITSKAGVPEPTTFAVTGGTGSFDGAHGTVGVTFGSQFNIFTITLL